MKRILLLTLLSFASGLSFAQSHIPLDSFYVPGTTWTEVLFKYYGGCSNCIHNDTTGHTYTIVRNSIVAGQVYHLLAEGTKGGFGVDRSFGEYETTRWMYAGTGEPSGDIIGMIRTDSVRVYLTYLDHTYTVVPGLCDSFGAEYVLFDFGLDMGDTFPGNNLSSGFTVTSIDSVLLSDGRYVKRFNDHLVYGIGAMDGFVNYWHWNICGPGPGTGQNLLCYENPRFSYRFSHPPGFLPRNLQYDCFDMEAHIRSLAAPDVTRQAVTAIFPNPVSSELNVTVEVPISSLQVLAPSGKVLLEQNPARKAAVIDVSILPPGIYFLRINQSSIARFIKE